MSATTLEDRLRRAFRADRWVPPSALLGILAQRSPAEARRAYSQAAIAAGRSASGVVRLESFLTDGLPDPLLTAVREAGIDLQQYLGTHELASHLVMRNVGRCVEADMAVHGPQVAVEAALAVLRAIDHPALQSAFSAHPRAASLRHFARLCEGTDLGGARAAYLGVLERHGVAPERSRVGWVEISLRGDPDQARALVDWDRVAQERSDGKVRPVPLVCGVLLPPSHEDVRQDHFSVLELLARDREPHALALADGIPEPGEPPTEPGWLPPGDAVVDRLLSVIAIACGVMLDHLPPWPRPMAPRLPREGADALLAALAGLPVTLALGNGAPPAQSDLTRLLGLAVAVSAHDPALTIRIEAIEQLPENAGIQNWEESWRAALEALLCWRVATLLQAFVVRRPAIATRLPEVANVWLGQVPYGELPPGRVRTPGRARPERAPTPQNRFGYDPAGRVDDARMSRVAWTRSYDQLALATWLVNEWEWGGKLLDLTGEAAVRALAPRMSPDRDLNAFKKAVSTEGYVLWSLTEIDAALEWGRSQWAATVAPRRWRLDARRALGSLPSRAWAASWPNVVGEGRIPALARILAPTIQP